MRRFRPLLAAMLLAAAAIALSSCGPEPRDFDKALLTGHWQEGTNHEVYFADGTGHTWDTADDVTEDEAQPFTWTLDRDQLLHIHKGAMGQEIPKTYTVTRLDATNLDYEDDYGKRHSFVKAAQ